MTDVVIFRRMPVDDFYEGELIAIFPELAWKMDFNHCVSYMHVGQHGPYNIEWLNKTTPASTDEPEVQSLFAELEEYGYNLRVCKRVSSKMNAKRYSQVFESKKVYYV